MSPMMGQMGQMGQMGKIRKHADHCILCRRNKQRHGSSAIEGAARMKTGLAGSRWGHGGGTHG